MWQRAKQWFYNIPITDPLERQQAPILQAILIIMIVIATIGMLLSTALGIAILFTTVILYIATLFILRRGHFQAAVWSVAAITLISLFIGLFTTGLDQPNSGISILGFAIPIVFIGLLGKRWALWITTFLAILSAFVVAIFQEYVPTFTLPSKEGITPISIAISMALVVSIITTFIDRFNGSLRHALTLASERERELANISASQERIISERTGDLQAALTDLQAREIHLRQTLAENELQRDTIRQMSIPILPVAESIMVVPLIGALDSSRLNELQEQTLSMIERSRIKQLVLDITGVTLVDSQIAQGLITVMRSANLMGTKVVLVGIRPEVAQTIVGLGFHLQIETYANLQSALQRIQP